MPVISRFYGIVVVMYFNDHQPPHVHAKYSGYEAMVSFDGAIVEGDLPARAFKLVRDWVICRQGQLMDNWRRANAGLPLEYIAPLE
ncbi:MAG: DUF4160 domain-containing protein [Halieaceae bacterium]|jgi:hypothetical protein|nr:DUF4160 domain-containing protein [Halieaceae bacterium]